MITQRDLHIFLSLRYGPVNIDDILTILRRDHEILIKKHPLQVRLSYLIKNGLIKSSDPETVRWHGAALYALTHRGVGQCVDTFDWHDPALIRTSLPDKHRYIHERNVSLVHRRIWTDAQAGCYSLRVHPEHAQKALPAKARLGLYHSDLLICVGFGETKKFFDIEIDNSTIPTKRMMTKFRGLKFRGYILCATQGRISALQRAVNFALTADRHKIGRKIHFALISDFLRHGLLNTTWSDCDSCSHNIETVPAVWDNGWPW